SFSLLSSLPPLSPLFPYTTLFRSLLLCVLHLRFVQQPEDLAHPVVGAYRRRAGKPDFQPVRRGDVRGLEGQDMALLVVGGGGLRSEEHTSELQSRFDLVCRLLLEK